MQHPILSAAVALLLTPQVAGQISGQGTVPGLPEIAASPEHADLSEMRFPHPDHVVFEATEDGTQWAVGLRYKVAAGPGGLAYAPYRSAAPRNEVLEWTPALLSIGGEPLPFDAKGAAARDGNALTLNRGALVERLECTTEAVEFMAEAWLPEGARGALELHYSTGPAYQVLAAPGGGLVFRGELGDVFMGAAFAVETGGLRTPIDLEPTPDGFRFVVPAETVARSHGHVVIDPLLSSDEITNLSSASDVAVDVAAYNGQFLVAIERVFSGNDHDVVVYRVNPANLSSSFVGGFNTTFEDWRDPSLAVRASRDDMLLAAQAITSSGPEIRCIWAEAQGPNRGFSFPVMDGFEPDICVETTNNGLSPRWAVVCIADDPTSTPVFRRMVGGTGTGVGPIGPIYSFQPNGTVREVAIAEVTGPGDITGQTEFRMAIYVDGVSGKRIWIRRFNRDGPSIGFATLVQIDGTVRHLSVCSLGEAGLGPNFRTFAVAYEETDPLTGVPEVKVVASSVGSALGEPVAVGELMNVARGLGRRRPSIASDGVRWTLSFEEDEQFTLPARVVLVEGSYAGGRFGLTGRRITQSGFFGDYTRPATIAGWVGGAGGTQDSLCLTAYLGRGGVRAALTQPIPQRAAGVQECEAERNSATSLGAWLSVLGSADTQSPKTVRLQNAPPGQFCLLLTASAPGFVPGVSGSSGNLCLGLPGFGRFNADLGAISTGGTRDVVFDPTAIPQALGTTAASLGDSWWVQAWFRDTSSAGPTSNFSNAVRIRFDH